MHDSKELAGEGGERLHVPPLPFGIQHVERERRFPRPRDARDDDELVPGDHDADIFEVVLEGTEYGAPDSEMQLKQPSQCHRGQ